jgi:hypothetical protein
VTKLDKSEKVRQLAYDLQIPTWNFAPVDGILDYCLVKIENLIPQKAKSIKDIEQVISDKLSLEIVEIWQDSDLDALVNKFVRLGEYVFADLPRRLNNNWTFAELLRLRKTSNDAPKLWLAVIDCRGPAKSNRRFFTRWHEIAHLLTLTPQMTMRLEISFNRSGLEKCPIESLMDVIAGEVAFYRPLFVPIVQSEIRKQGQFTFDTIEAIRNRFRPEASFQSAALAAVKNAPMPAIMLEAKLALKKSEAKAVAAPQREFFEYPEPTLKLRATSVVSNDAARQIGLRINPNMRIPEDSLISEAFCDDPLVGSNQRFEDLGTWGHSDGTFLPSRRVRIETRKFDEVVHALITVPNV